MASKYPEWCGTRMFVYTCNQSCTQAELPKMFTKLICLYENGDRFMFNFEVCVLAAAAIDC